MLSANMSKHNKIQKGNSNNGIFVRQPTSFSGPLPPPEVLEKFERVSPGAAKIIVDMAKNQSEHRQGLENRVIDSGINNSKLGLIFGLTIGMVGILMLNN